MDLPGKEYGRRRLPDPTNPAFPYQLGSASFVFPRRVVKVAAVALACLLLAAAFFYPVTLTWLAEFLVLSERPQPADLILILGGDFWGPRSLKGAELGAKGYAKRVLISGPPYKGRPESDLSVDFLVEKGYRREMFLSFPISGKSTTEEGIAVCPELRRLQARNVILVTSAYHSRRASIVFSLFCPGVGFRSAPAADPQFEVENWWKKDSFRAIFFSEWQKILGTILWRFPQYQIERLMGRRT